MIKAFYLWLGLSIFVGILLYGATEHQIPLWQCIISVTPITAIPVGLALAGGAFDD